MRLIVSTILIVFSFTLAQAELDVWDFISVPSGVYIPKHRNPDTKQKAIENIKARLPSEIREAVAPYWTIKLAKIALLNERPHANTATNALFLATIPASETVEPELRYFAAFKRELTLQYDDIVSECISMIQFSHGEYYTQDASNVAPIWVIHTHARSDMIVDLMSLLEGITSLSSLAANPDFVRNSVLVEHTLPPRSHWFTYLYQPLTGIEITSSTNPVSLKIGAITQRLSYPASTTLAMREFHRLGNVGTNYQVNQTAGATLTSKNGPNLITVGTTSTVLNKDASRVLTFQELGQGVKSQPIDLPVATRTLPDITLEQAEVQSVNIDGLFTGIRFTTAVTTSDSSKVTVSKATSGSTMGVTGVSIGSAVVNVSATNEAGTTTTSFTVIVTSNEGE